MIFAKAATFLLFASILIFGSPCFASKCAPQSFENQFKKSETVFLGEVKFVSKDIKDGCKCDELTTAFSGSSYVTFKVKKIWKGRAGSQIVLLNHSEYRLGHKVSAGEEWIVFSDTHHIPSMQTVCWGSQKATPIMIKKLDAHASAAKPASK